jgi:hypothetical protein
VGSVAVSSAVVPLREGYWRGLPEMSGRCDRTLYADAAAKAISPGLSEGFVSSEGTVPDAIALIDTKASVDAKASVEAPLRWVLRRWACASLGRL